MGFLVGVTVPDLNFQMAVLAFKCNQNSILGMIPCSPIFLLYLFANFVEEKVSGSVLCVKCHLDCI